MLSLKPATHHDYSTIEALAKEIWNVHYTPIIGQEQVNYMLNTLYSIHAIEKQVREGQDFFLVTKGERKNGFLSLSSDGRKNYFLHKFYILTGEQNKGLGTSVFKMAFEELFDAESIRLTVNRKNFKSVNFYFKLGFSIEKVEDFDIGQGFFMNDYVMLWKKKRDGRSN